jgi:hypothetical protein
MSLENITGFVRELLQEDDSMTGANNCRDSVLKIKNEIDKNYPTVKTSILVYPEASEGVGVHYSLLVKHGENEILVNVVAAPGFPIYIGDLKKAVPTFSSMKITTKVI